MRYSVIILLSILGAAVIVLIGWAVLHHFQSRYRPIEPAADPEPSWDQVAYMREVRQRNIQRLVWAVAEDYGRRPAGALSPIRESHEMKPGEMCKLACSANAVFYLLIRVKGRKGKRPTPLVNITAVHERNAVN